MDTLTDLIKKYITIFGSDITLAKIHQIKGLTFSGNVDTIHVAMQNQVNQEEIMSQVKESLSELSPFVARKYIVSSI